LLDDHLGGDVRQSALSSGLYLAFTSARIALMLLRPAHVRDRQLRHTTPKITPGLYTQAVSADQQKAHKKVVQMVLPAKFPEKFKARNAAPTA